MKFDTHVGFFFTYFIEKVFTLHDVLDFERNGNDIGFAMMRFFYVFVSVYNKCSK